MTYSFDHIFETAAQATEFEYLSWQFFRVDVRIIRDDNGELKCSGTCDGMDEYDNILRLIGLVTKANPNTDIK